MVYPHLTERERAELRAFHDSFRGNLELAQAVEDAAAEATRLPRRWAWYALALAVAVVSASAWFPMHWWGGA